ncbi:MAG: hypothetical protein MJZ92_02255 [Paludibacteraceae bacterium]|nr:hypothetical protein [Paludibacteraceae bacterium]
MLDKLKDRIFMHYLHRQPPRHVLFPDYASARSVLILYESDVMEKNLVVKDLRDRLLKEDKDVVLWGYADKKDILSPILPQSRIFGRKDINLLGAPREELINELHRREYNLLIDLTQHPCRPLHYIAMYARAHFKAGMDIVEGIHDLRIHTEPQKEPTYLFEQITFYLRNIHSNDKA